MKEKLFKNDIWFNSSHQILESYGNYKGIDYAIRYDLRRCIRCIEVRVRIAGEDRYIKSPNPWLKIADCGARSDKLKLSDYPDFIMILDEYFDNPDPKLMGSTILKNVYRPYDLKHIGTAEYYDNLALEFIDWYLTNF